MWIYGSHAGPATSLKIAVKAPATIHEVRFSKIEAWLQSAGKPNEQGMKGRLRELLGDVTALSLYRAFPLLFTSDSTRVSAAPAMCVIQNRYLGLSKRIMVLAWRLALVVVVRRTEVLWKPA
jgi:hypothetical protein